MTLRGLVNLSVATLTYGALHVIDKAALNAGSDPTLYTISRVIVAALLLYPFAHLQTKELFTYAFLRSHAKDLAIIGVLGSGIGLLLQITGLRYSSVSNVSLLLALVAPCTSFFAAACLGERISGRHFMATALMLLGTAGIYWKNTFSGFGFGDCLVLLAIIGYAYNNVHAQKTMRRVSTVTVTWGRLVFGSISLALIFPFVNLDFHSLTYAPWIVLSGGAVFALRMFTYFRGIELEGAAVAATFILLSPVVSVTTAHIFLAEPLTLQVVLAMLCVICGGMVLVNPFKKLKKRASAF